MANVDTCHYIQVEIIIVKNVLSCSQRLLFRNVDIERFEIISSLISYRFSRFLRAEPVRLVCPVQTNQRETPRHLPAPNDVINAPSIWSAGRTDGRSACRVCRRETNLKTRERRRRLSVIITELSICFCRRAAAESAGINLVVHLTSLSSSIDITLYLFFFFYRWKQSQSCCRPADRITSRTEHVICKVYKRRTVSHCLSAIWTERWRRLAAWPDM